MRLSHQATLFDPGSMGVEQTIRENERSLASRAGVRRGEKIRVLQILLVKDAPLPPSLNGGLAGGT
jgi:hypothetical protein